MAERWSTGLRNAVLKAGGNSLADELALGVIYLYTGSQPINADASEGTATKLVELTEVSVAYVASTGANGLMLDTATDGVVTKDAVVWSGVNVAGGVVGWGRFYGNANPIVTGASTTAVRFDFSVSTSGADVTCGNTTLVISETTTMSTFTITFPAS